MVEYPSTEVGQKERCQAQSIVQVEQMLELELDLENLINKYES